MAKKLESIVELAAQTARQITASSDNYMAFLTTAAHNFKYSFRDQLLIFAQKPDATACAQIDFWNKRGRWVNRGTTGIALLVDTERGYRLRHVFDMSDTNSREGRTIPIWQMKPQYDDAVIEALENSYGELGVKPDFAACLLETANIIVADNFSDYYADLCSVKAGSFLEELDEDSSRIWFKNLLENSVAFMLLTRCGIDAGDHFTSEDFAHVFEFNTPETLSILGAATSDISEMALREIATTVLSLYREEQKQNRTFAQRPASRYNDGRIKTERNGEHGTDIQDRGRLPSAQPGRAGGTQGRKIWDAAAQLPPQEQERDLHRADAVRQVGQPSGRDRPAGHRDGEQPDGTDGGGAGREREPESIRSVEVGGPDEQHPGVGGGNGADGAGVRLTDPLPSEEEQRQAIREAEDEKSSAFSISQEDIDAVLLHGSGVADGKFRIFEQFETVWNSGENIPFLKEEYKSTTYFSVTTDKKLNAWCDPSGMKISIGELSAPEGEVKLTWKKAAKRIGQLVEADRYLSPAEKEKYPEYQRQHDARSASVKVSEELNPPPPPKKEYRFSLGDTVYLGAQEYELLAFDEQSVRLFDPSFPLINKELPRAEFDRLLAENPLNDHLLQMVEETSVPEPVKDDTALETTKQLINEYCMEEFDQEADFTDLHHVDLAFGSTSDSEHTVEVSADLIDCRLIYQVDGEVVVSLQCHDLDDLSGYLADLDFDEMIAFAEEQYKTQQAQKANIATKADTKMQDAREVTSPAEFSVGDIIQIGADDEVPEYRVLETKKSVSDENGLFVTMYGFTAYWDRELKHLKFTNTSRLPDTEPIKVIGRVIPGKEPAEKAVDTGDTGKGPDGVALRSIVIELGAGPDHEEEKAPTLAAPKPRKRPSPFVLHPEIPTAERHEYRITDEHLGEGGAKAKFKNNIAAIQTLKKIEDEERLATPDEQEILAQYVGWGGLPQAFDADNGAWADEFVRLQAVLSDEEYSAVRASTLNAHYTSPTVIKATYQAVENLGFQTGNILEPSCGIGNFFGLLPESMADSKLYGVELDPITGRIAQQLYQKSSIAVQGFEKTDLPDSFFDLAIGNVPFGSYTLNDKRYNKHHFLIHDYFFVRTLDKVRPSGIVAFVTSKGTLDKKKPDVRKYIAERADLLGAIRLPNNAFLANAGTKVATDVIFLQKRDKLVSAEPEWVHLGQTNTGVPINQYFIDHPEMVLGEMAFDDMMYGNNRETTCMPFEGQDLGEQLAAAIQNIQGSITEYMMDDPEAEGEDKSIPADPEVRNFSYTVVDGQVYYRENSIMNPVEASVTAANRIKGLIGIRDCVRTLIEYQTEDWSDENIRAEQQKLNSLYDAFVKNYGRINSRANSTAFSMDSAYFLLTSLEVLDDERNFVRKADMFTKRTIRQKVTVTSVDTASEALAVSLAEKAKVDMSYMMELTGKTEQEIYADLTGVIFLNPMHGYGGSAEEKYLPADEYLSGNVREKLEWAKRSAALNPEDYTANVQALERVQPVDLTASEISVRLGADWLPIDVVQQFMYELLGTPHYAQFNIKVHHSKYTREWNVEGKSFDKANIKAQNTYGTARANGYKIIEETLNLRDVRIFDYIEDENGKRTAVLNKKETAIAQGKQELIKQEFQDWIWKDPQRRERLTKLYNEKFNSIRPREYDGSHLNFVGMNPEITLRPHQVNAIAHILYGGNTLLAHVVGAGKTFEMVAAAQESKRLGLCQKSLFVVPNHLTEQWAAEYLQLYPSANILVATKKDFETKNRKRFCGRIATGDYDAIIIGHSQFEKIPMSVERQRYLLEQQRREILDGIAELKSNHGDRFSVKQLERTRKSIDAKLDKLNDQSRKDGVVTFEELGIDRLFVDEAHYYKNLAAFSKMRNVGGISQTEAQKSSDLYMKCRYLDELTGGRGVIFATGTPISNTMVEMYTMQKYLQHGLLQEKELLHFDAWASTFGETVTAIELAPEGTGYRAKTRFAKFYNLPELMSMFKEVADIQTADMLNLPVPKANYHNIVLKPSEHQKEMVAALGARAERVRNRMVDSSVDNMLLITNDGRKLALDQRLLNPILPDSDTSKINACAENVFEIWQRTADQRSTQMIFCDLSTPGKDRPIEMTENEEGTFEMTPFQNVYDDLRDKLIARGIPAEEIAYIHTANTEVKKAELFGKVRSGQIRVLLGSTQKMGAGTNVQHKLIALHHLDCPWRPSDLQQREGRIIRQKNENDEVDIYTYVTENTFDSYLYQLVEGKQKFIGQIMTSKSPVRSAEDIDETALSYAEIKALCTGNPHIKEKMDLDIEVQRLKLLKANHLSQRYALEDKIIKELPQKIASFEQRIEGFTADMTRLKENTHPNEDGFSPMKVEGTVYTDKKAAGSAILAACKAMTSPDPVPLGQYRGFDMELSFNNFSREYQITMKGALHHTATLGTDIYGNILRLNNVLGTMEERLIANREQLENTNVQLANAKAEIEKPFSKEDELKTKMARLDELNILLNMDKRENEIVDGERDEDVPAPDRNGSDRER